MASRVLEAAIESATGQTVEQLRSMPIDQRRAEIEEKLGRPMEFRSVFPVIGRGNVLRDRMISHSRVESEFRRALHGG